MASRELCAGLLAASLTRRAKFALRKNLRIIPKFHFDIINDAIITQIIVLGINC